MTGPEADCLRKAALILGTRARKKTFALRVVIRVLQRAADSIEAGGRHPSSGDE